MELVTVTNAIELIKSASPGEVLYIGLYENAKNEENYSNLAKLLGCSEGDEIFDGPYKVYSNIEYLSPYAVGWIDGKAYRPDREPGLYDDTTECTVRIGKNGYFYFWDYYNDFKQVDMNRLAAAITNGTNVTAIYDANLDKILLTAKIEGDAGVIELVEPANKSYWDNSDFEFISGTKLDLDIDNIKKQNGAQVWIKNTDLRFDNDEEVKQGDIKMVVRPGLDGYPLELDFTQRWKWDECDEVDDLPEIDWGDGQIEKITNIQSIKHTYATAGEYVITFYNIHWLGWSGNGAPAQNAMPVTEIEFIKSQVLSAPANSFRSLEILKKISGKIYTTHSYRANSGHAYMFLYDAELEDLSNFTIHFGPGIDGSGIKTVNSIFWGCTKLTDESLKKLTVEHIDKNSIQTANYLFNNSGISSIDNSFIGSGLKEASYCFSNNKNLAHLESGILDNLVVANHMFEGTGIVSCDKSFGLPSLVNGDCMFFGTEMPYTVIEQIYNSLTPAPENADYGKGSNNEPENYAITFGYNVDEPNIEEKLAKLLNIEEGKWHRGLPFWIFGQYDNSNDKRWYISFTNRNNVN